MSRGVHMCNKKPAHTANMQETTDDERERERERERQKAARQRRGLPAGRPRPPGRSRRLPTDDPPSRGQEA
eukprot:258689-Pyramimonas_sp.AAC.1